MRAKRDMGMMVDSEIWEGRWDGNNDRMRNMRWNGRWFYDLLSFFSYK